MSEPVKSEQTDVSAASGSPGQKRKRDADSPESQRSKRAAPPATMSADNNAFLEHAIEGSQTVATSADNVADFSALQQVAAADRTDVSDPSNATTTAQAALGLYPTLHVPPSTEEQFAAQVSPDGRQGPDDAFSPEVAPPEGMMDAPAANQENSPNGSHSQGHRYSTSSATPKPSVGSEEWHKMRKDNHKEVERRRRETINEGINELAKIVPGCEKNKGSILQRAVSFISQLKENEQQNIEKWTLEKLLTEQAITELSASNDKLKQECERLYRELETWKRVAQNAGLEPPQAREESNADSGSG